MFTRRPFLFGIFVGLMLGGPLAVTKCFPVEPAHAQSADYSDAARLVRAIEKQTTVLERLVRATEKCK